MLNNLPEATALTSGRGKVSISPEARECLLSKRLGVELGFKTSQGPPLEPPRSRGVRTDKAEQDLVFPRRPQADFSPLRNHAPHPRASVSFLRREGVSSVYLTGRCDH